MLDVFLTVDVEVWCGGWKDLDATFPGAFRRYIYGPTPDGDYALPFALRVLKDHGLTGVFFVEPLFSTRFGQQPLQTILGLIGEYEQEVQLHLHTEWVDESIEPLLPNVVGKRQHLRHFSLEEQTQLIAVGVRLLREAGAPPIHAFRAGSFGFNLDTLRALAINKIPFDSSYNATLLGTDSGLMPGTPVVEPLECQGVCEYPMTVFADGTGSLRHAQVSACSYRELEHLLWEAHDTGRRAFVVLSHNFELLSRGGQRHDPIAVKRFRKLCSFLDRNRDSFTTRGFRGLDPRLVPVQPAPLTSSLWRTSFRILEQARRRMYR